MPHDLHVRVSNSLWEAIRAHADATGDSVAHLVQTALADALDLKHHSIFQVSTSGALVQGVYDGCVSVGDVRRHGDFGIGTFDGLDGEMIMVDGHCFQARADGSVTEAPDDALTPFAVVSWFRGDDTVHLDGIAGWDELCAGIDVTRHSPNEILGLRAHGTFESLYLRAACPPHANVGLVEATRSQVELELVDVTGTLVGFWFPEYTHAIGIPGYHFHFVSDDRAHGGHVLGLRADAVDVDIHRVSDIHLAIPETEQFLTANLGIDPTEALEIAEARRTR